MGDRILVTGMGVVSPVGTGTSAYWEGLLNGESHPQNAPSLDPERIENRLMYRVNSDEPRESVRGRAFDFAIRSGEMCLEAAGLTRSSDGTIGVSIGSGMGSADLLEAEREGRRTLEPEDRFSYSLSARLAEAFDLTGPNFSVSTACSASGYSIGIGAQAIRDGWADAMLVGGAEGFSRIPIACFNRLGALDPLTCRPFDTDRAGTVFGEGAAIMLLESESHFRRRGGSRVYAELRGSGWSCDAYHATAPEPSGASMIRALHDALGEAEIRPEEVDCVIPHGTGTALNDLVESQVIGAVFGERVRELRVCAIKSMVGHGGGAAGAFSVLTAAMILGRGVVPPTANIRATDPRCALRLHRGRPEEARVRNVLVNAYAFGGNNISLVLGRYDAA